MRKITNERDGTAFECDDNDTILRAALRAGVGMAYSCNVGSCGNCRFELIDGDVEHIRDDPPAWSERDARKNKWLGCQARPLGDCTVKFRPDAQYVSESAPKRMQGTLTKIAPITRDITEFTFELPDAPDFQPGQYALLSVPGVEGGRAYSMCNLAGGATWSFQIRRVPGGAATEVLFEKLAPGATVDIDGPYGTAHLRPGIERDIILIAGGSGLSPMVSIARGARAANMLPERKVHFYYGCRTGDDAISAAYLDSELGFVDNFVTAVSDPAHFEGWSGATGFLHDVCLSDFGETLKNYEIYFAGPPIMAASIQKMAYENGVPADQLHFDEFY
jgi:2-polyprenylphenol hydroxylase and related flavodoxin oxidoreductases